MCLFKRESFYTFHNNLYTSLILWLNSYMHTLIFWIQYTVSASMQRQGSIFQNGFLGGVQFKKSLKKWTFKQKSGVLFKKTPQKVTFQKHEVLFKSGVALTRIRYAKLKTFGNTLYSLTHPKGQEATSNNVVVIISSSNSQKDTNRFFFLLPGVFYFFPPRLCFL